MFNADLSLVGLLFIAPLLPLSPLAVRAALEGGHLKWLDTFIIIPGMQLSTRPADLNEGEYPACAAMTTGYVFRVENQATVFYLQRSGKAGCLTTLHVETAAPSVRMSNLRSGIEVAMLYFPLVGSAVYARGAIDFWFLAILATLYISRLLNILVLRGRSSSSWHGASEPGVQGDLLILLSEDRWIRMKGLADDLKAVTSGSWLRKPNNVESCLTFTATFLVYLAAILAVNVSRVGKYVLLLLALVQLPFLCASNTLRWSEGLQMQGRIVKLAGPPKQYRRRLDLAEELVKETGRDDWAIKLGMINRKTGTSEPNKEGVIM